MTHCVGRSWPPGEGELRGWTKICNCKSQPICQSCAATWWIQTRSWVDLSHWCCLLPNYFGLCSSLLMVVMLLCISLRMLLLLLRMILASLDWWRHRWLFFTHFMVQMIQTFLPKLWASWCRLTSFCMTPTWPSLDSLRCVYTKLCIVELLLLTCFVFSNI